MINAKTPLQLSEIYNHLPCACVTVDSAGKIVNANNSFLNYTGYELDQILNILNIEDFLPSENHIYINHLVDLRPNQSENSNIKYVSLISKDNQKMPCTISSKVLDTGTDIFHYYTFIDFSRKIVADKAILDEQIQLKIAEQRLVKLTLELQMISHTISNEIQNPLHNILGLINLLKKKYSNAFDNRGLKFLDHIGDSGEKMRHHFNALLENSTNGKSITDKKYVNLNDIVENVKLKLKEEIINNKVFINIPEPLPSIYGIADDLRLLFNNLIKNAIQFKGADNSPIIDITFTEEGPLYHFTIEDNGIGIDKKYHEKVFEEYFKLDADGDECNGRGLPESRAIVENHKGSIGVISNLNKGCTVYFSLEK